MKNEEAIKELIKDYQKDSNKCSQVLLVLMADSKARSLLITPIIPENLSSIIGSPKQKFCDWFRIFIGT